VGIFWVFIFQLLGLIFGTVLFIFYFSIAVFAPRSSYSFSTAKKSNQKMPPRQLRPCKKTQGFPLKCGDYHAAPELAKGAQTAGSDGS